MANKKISSLTSLGAAPAIDDIIPITDISDTTGSLQGTTKKVTVANLVAVAPQGDLESANNLSDLADAATARTNLGVDAAGTDNSTNVTLATVANNYLSLSGQEITAGIVPVSLGGTGSGDLATARVNLGLGTAATQDVGTANGNVVQLDATGLPAVDGSQLTNVSSTDSSKLAIASNLSDLNDAATARTNLGLGTAATTASTDYATSAQGGLADTAVQPAGIANMVETTDSIDVLADVDTSTVAPTNGQALVWDNTAGQWEPGDAGASSIDDLSDVDTSTTAPTTNDFLKWGGTNWVPAVPTADVDTPLTTALRGTDNPHIGAYPNQSFKVIDNPNKSVMVIADADGNVTYLLNSTTAEVRVAKGATGTPTRFALASELPAFVLENDSGEPDIEVTDSATGEKISVISGDSDTKGANGLPTRQGFSLPDIGANPAPILISGGTIA